MPHLRQLKQRWRGFIVIETIPMAEEPPLGGGGSRFPPDSFPRFAAKLIEQSRGRPLDCYPMVFACFCYAGSFRESPFIDIALEVGRASLLCYTLSSQFEV